MSAFYKLTDSYVSFDLGKCSPKRFGTKICIPESPTDAKIAQTFEEVIVKSPKISSPK